MTVLVLQLSGARLALEASPLHHEPGVLDEQPEAGVPEGRGARLASDGEAALDGGHSDRHSRVCRALTSVFNSFFLCVSSDIKRFVL